MGSSCGNSRRRVPTEGDQPSEPTTFPNQLNPTGRPSWSHLFASKRFHVLLNSLFKVLSNFPSPYLFAIGHLSVFSLRWSLPPTLGCILKQPDSKDATRDSSRQPTGLTPALGEGPRSRELGHQPTTPCAVLNTTGPNSQPRTEGFGAGLFPLHSPLLGES